MCKHGGDDIVEYDLSALGGGVVQTPKGPHEVGPAGDDQGKNGGDDGSGMNRALVPDGVEFVDHLRKAPGSQAGEQNHTEQADRIRPKEGNERAVEVGSQRRFDLRKLFQRCEKTALSIQDADHYHSDACNHNDSLHQIIERGGHISADHHINCGQQRDSDNAPDERNAESH